MSEAKKTQLEIILIDLQSKIDSKNGELSDLTLKYQAKVDAINGDARIQRDGLLKEIEELTFKKANIEAEIAKEMADVNAQKIALASDKERLNDALVELNNKQAQLQLSINDYELKMAGLRDWQFKLNAQEQGNNLRSEAISKSEEIASEEYQKATKESEEATDKYNEAIKLLEKTKQKTDEMLNQANSKVNEANELLEKVKILQANADSQMAVAKAIKDEYTAKLEESRQWADDNSAVSNKLASWEAALRVADRKIQDDRAKLAVAEKDFAAKLKGGNING